MSTKDEESRRVAFEARESFARISFCESMLSDFGMVALSNPHKFTARGIEDIKKIADAVLANSMPNEKENQQLRIHLLHAFWYVAMFSDDKDAKEAAQKAMETTPYPFSPDNGQVRKRP